MGYMRAVLIVHENHEVRQRLCTALGRCGYPTLTSSSAHEALTVMKHEWPALILAGERLQDTTGVELARHIRAFNERVPILLLHNGRSAGPNLLQAPQVQAVLAEDIPEEQIGQEIAQWVQGADPPSRVRWPGTILVVDDEPKLCAVLREFLHMQGFAVVTAASGEAALESVAASVPAVVLLDVHLPGIDGLSALKRIKALNPHITVIMITGLEEEETMGQALALGAHDYILKPFNLAYLQTTLLSKLLLGQTP